MPCQQLQFCHGCAFLQEISDRGDSAVAMKWIGRSPLWSGLRLPFHHHLCRGDEHRIKQGAAARELRVVLLKWTQRRGRGDKLNENLSC